MSDQDISPHLTKAIAAFQAEDLARELLLRQMLAFGKWMVPVAQVGDVTPRTQVGDDGVPTVVAFSHPDMLEAAEASGDADDLAEEMAGVWATIGGYPLVRAVGNGRLRVNPYTAQALTLPPEQMREFAAIAHLEGVERALRAAVAPPIPTDALKAIAAFEQFEVIVRGPQTLDLAPDTKNRKLLAAFTSPACRDAYLDQEKDRTFKHGVPRVLPLTGVELAEKLESLDILGVVFNCAGPVPPCALHKHLGRHVLGAVREG